MEPLGTGIEDQPHDGFWTLWEVQRGKLMSYCLGLMGGSEEEAKDALSGTLLKALDAWEINRDRLDNPAGWLFRIAHNHCMDQYRDARNRLRSEADPDDLSARNRDFHPDLPESPEDTFLRREMHVNLEEALAKLPDRLRDVMILHCVKEFSYQEIAEELGLTEVNVRKRIQLGREWIRNYLDGYLKEDKGTLPANVINPGNGEKILADSVIIDPYQDLRLRQDHGRQVFVRNRKNEITETIAFSHHASRRLTQKITAAEKYIQKYPSGWIKRQYLANLYYLGGRWQECLAQTEIVLNKNPKLIEPQIQKSKILLAQGEKRKALDTLRQAISHNPKPGIRYYLDGVIALINRQYPMAVRAFRKSVEIAPDKDAFREALSRAHLAMGDPTRALSTLGNIQTETPSLATLSLRYQAYKDLGAETNANRMLDRLLDLFPDDLPALEQKTVTRLASDLVYGEEGKITRGLIRGISKQAPESSVPVALQAEYHFLRGKGKKALELLQRFVDQTPSSLPGRYHAARMHYLQNQPTEALLELTSTPGLQSGKYLLPAILDLQVNHYSDQGPYHLDSHPDWEWLSANAWLQASKWDRKAQAVSLGEAMLEFRSGWPASWYRKGWLDLIAERYEEAKSAFVHAWDLLPDGDGYRMRAGISFSMHLLHSLTHNEKEATYWRDRLTAWLLLIEKDHPRLSSDLSKFYLPISPAQLLKQNPLIYFLSPFPPLWLHAPAKL